MFSFYFFFMYFRFQPSKIALNLTVHKFYGSFPSCLEGWSRLKEKWNEYNQPKKMKKLISLFISPNGERVAVAAGNQITILWKDDDYLEPCGTFTSKIHFC